ncbi:MAG TPA: hypothetical protein VNC84_07165 [Gammaproteobacteria bacterium]|jgi:hypothetical protein|nr:hypothetical protein [Gammaproteobacteria bacterium]
MNEERDDLPDESEIIFFKKILSSHDKISRFSEIDPQQFNIERGQGLSSVMVYLSGFYIIGIADCMDIIEEYSDVNCIVTSSSWKSYTKDAKEYASSKRIGLFDISEFMGALNRDDFWNYVKKDNK